jgi:hypothetical protein
MKRIFDLDNDIETTVTVRIKHNKSFDASHARDLLLGFFIESWDQDSWFDVVSVGSIMLEGELPPLSTRAKRCIKEVTGLDKAHPQLVANHYAAEYLRTSYCGSVTLREIHLWLDGYKLKMRKS